jgi:phage gp36-like protein
MKYINKDDLISIIQERLMTESVALATESTLDENTILDDIEEKAIDLVISYISGIYKHAEIFAVTPIRNGVLVQIIASIVVYRSVKRNAARKVPDDYVELYKEAIKYLENIQSGAMSLINCPKLTTTEGTTVSPVWGNNTNKDFFI